MKGITFETSNKQKLIVMNEKLRAKVEAKLIKQGNNIDDVKKMLDLHFDYAVRIYPTVKTIAECIRTIY